MRAVGLALAMSTARSILDQRCISTTAGTRLNISVARLRMGAIEALEKSS